MTFAIETRGLSKSYGRVQALDGLDLQVPAGCVFGFLGPNGAGKTTTLHVLLGLLPADRGDVHVLGHDVRRHAHEVRARCGVLLEHDGLYERLSVLDNLSFHARQFGVGKRDAIARAYSLLEHTGWSERAEDPAAQLSRGMKRRLAVLRAFITNPELVFLDEPTSGFDPQVAAELREFLVRVTRETGATVFLTTHNMKEAEAMCDQVAVVRAGRAVAAGTPGQLRSAGPRIRIIAEGIQGRALAALRRRKEIADISAEQDGILLHLHNDAPAAPIVASLVRNGIAIEGVERVRASLEDEFLSLMEAP